MIKPVIALLLLTLPLLLLGCHDSTSDNENSFVVKAKYLQEEEAERKRTNTSEGIMVMNSAWGNSLSDADALEKALLNKDAEFLNQLVLEGRVHIVSSETRVIFYNTPVGNGRIKIMKFLRGKYTDKSGYTLKEYIREY